MIGADLKDPYAVKTPLGWSIVGATDQGLHHGTVRYTNALESSVDVNALTFTCFSKPVKPANVLDILQQDFHDN